MGVAGGQNRREALTRLRWRMRGAWLWPLFVVLTLAEMALLHWLPISGEGTGFFAALLLAGTLNLIGVALLGGIGGALLRRARPEMPKVVADNYAGIAVLVLVAATFVSAGLVHRPQVTAQREAFSRQSQAVRLWVLANGDDFARAHVDGADTVALDSELFRTCVPGRDARRSLCLMVDTSKSPPVVRRDPNRESNSSFNPRGAFR